MISVCDCGQESTRLKYVKLDGKGYVWVCPQCQPSEFEQSRFASVSDKKIWLMSEVEPNQYETRDGKAVMKDWAQGEFEARIGREDPDDIAAKEAAKERKRKQVRERKALGLDRLSDVEIRRIDEQIKNARARAAALDAGLVLPA